MESCKIPIQSFIGFATCVVFAPLNSNGSKGRLIEVSYCVQTLNDVILYGTGIETQFFPNETRCYESDQVWLSYMVPTPDWEMRCEIEKDDIEVELPMT